jgi:hypothetical protein
MARTTRFCPETSHLEISLMTNFSKGGKKRENPKKSTSTGKVQPSKMFDNSWTESNIPKSSTAKPGKWGSRNKMVLVRDATYHPKSTMYLH